MDSVRVMLWYNIKHHLRLKANPRSLTQLCSTNQPKALHSGALNASHIPNCWLGKNIPFLTSSVPNLGLDGLVVDNESLCLELDPDRGLGFYTELVPCEPRQELRFPHRRVSDHDHLQHVVDLLVIVFLPQHIRHFSLSVSNWITQSDHRAISFPPNQSVEESDWFGGACGKGQRRWSWAQERVFNGQTLQVWARKPKRFHI